MKFLFITAFIFSLFTSCGTKKDSQDATEEEKSTKVETNTDSFQKAIIGEVNEETPLTKINSVKVNGNIIQLDVSYSGGCVEQHFDLVGAPMVMKTFPPKRNVKLVRSGGDQCRELVTKTLFFDLSELAEEKSDGAKTILYIKGYREELTYVYTKEESE